MAERPDARYALEYVCRDVLATNRIFRYTFLVASHLQGISDMPTIRLKLLSPE